MDIKELTWQTLEQKDGMGNPGLQILACDLGPFRGLIMQAATVNLTLDFICAVMDMRLNKTLYHTTKQYTHASLLVKGEGFKQEILVELADCAGVKLIEHYNDWVIEQILLGGNSED